MNILKISKLLERASIPYKDNNSYYLKKRLLKTFITPSNKKNI